MTHFAHFTHGYGGNTPRSARTLVKVVNGDTLTFTIHIRRPYSSEPVSSGDARKPDVSVVLSENRFYHLIWTGTLADGDITLDENVPGVAYVTVPRDVMSALRRGIYAFSVTVDDGERRETQTRGHIQVEYEPTSATHDIPYRADAWKGDVGISFRPPRVLTEYESVDAFPVTGVKGVLYLAADTNTLYRWDGSGYSRLGGSDDPGLTEEQAALIAQVPGKLDKSDVVALSEDAVAGQAADAKATFDALAAKADKATTLAGYGITDAATKTELDAVDQKAANAILGVQSELSEKADLVDGKVPAAQLPSFIDDVLEYDDISAFPAIGEAGKIYVAKDTNKTYRWSGTQYVEISPSLALGETSATAYPGDKGKVAAEKADEAYSAAESLANGVNSLAGTIGTHSRDTNNPHKVTAEQVEAYTKTEIDEQVISASNQTFSNAVLAVGLDIDMGSVEVLNEIAANFGGFPIEGTKTAVGGLLAALAAAVTWLRKNKVQTIKLNDGSVEKTAENGVAKLDDFFTNSNSLLTGTIESKVNSMFDNGDTTSYPRSTEV